MGNKHSSATAWQTTSQTINQQYSGVCNLSCQNVMNNDDISIINSNVGDITISQTCSVSAPCMINGLLQASSDAVQSSTNSASALPDTFPWQAASEHSTALSVQTINQQMNQSISEKCNISSVNQMSNVSLVVVGSSTGNIDIAQQGSVAGQCQLAYSMGAAAMATQTAQNTATSGKDKKGEKLQSKTETMEIITYIILGVVAVTMMTIIGKILGRDSGEGTGQGYPPAGYPPYQASYVQPASITNQLLSPQLVTALTQAAIEAAPVAAVAL